jgi:methylmalonyl-CoA epimerase
MDATPLLPGTEASRPGAVAMTFHHVGVAVHSLDETLRSYTEIFGFRLLGAPQIVPSEHVRVCFVEAGPGVLIELVEGLGADSPVAGILERSGSGPYHLCYRVDDLDLALGELRARGCYRVRTFTDGTGSARRFAFLLTPDRQLFEIFEERGIEPVRPAPALRRYSFGTLFFEATRRCNLSCAPCMTGSNDRDVVRRSRRAELDTDEIERRVLATARDIGTSVIAWSGGEFLVRRDAVELVRRATSWGYESTICTNAALVSPARLALLQEASGGTLVMAFGINSIDDESSWTRDGGREPTLRALELCREMGVRRHVVVNVGRHNLATLSRTLDWLDRECIPYNRSPFAARGSGRAYWDQLRFSRDDMAEVIHPALRRHPLGYISYTPFFLSPELHAAVSQGARNGTVPQNPSVGCWCGSWLAVNAEGDVAPCAILLDELHCGNVRERTLQEIVDSSPDFQRVLDRGQLKGKCGRCRYRLTCGGCRAMAFFESGDLMGEDPTCFFEPADPSTVSEHEEQTNRMFRRYHFMLRHSGRARSGATPAAGGVAPPR